ncbi:type II secretion system protein [Candidatus Woesebacteria bacterium]|nr:MAG: type II secretion system protein [Candidatus Woesebacteria bacterium]
MKRNLGFTLIELLIVIAILGVMAVVMLVVINPVERLAQSRDAGRISTITQLGHAGAAYYTDKASYPTEANWAQELIDAGTLKSFPAGVAYTANDVVHCASQEQPVFNPTFCYETDALLDPIMFARAEADIHNLKCTVGGAYFVYSFEDGRAGTVCSVDDPDPWAAGTQTYVE